MGKIGGTLRRTSIFWAMTIALMSRHLSVSAHAAGANASGKQSIQPPLTPFSGTAQLRYIASSYTALPKKAVHELAGTSTTENSPP